MSPPWWATSCVKGQVEIIIQKVIFLCAVGRPQWDRQKDVRFDGKIGIWSFIEKVAAKKNSINRPKGTLETKNIASVNDDEYKKMMIEKVLPAIKAKW